MLKVRKNLIPHPPELRRHIFDFLRPGKEVLNFSATSKILRWLGVRKVHTIHLRQTLDPFYWDRWLNKYSTQSPKDVVWETPLNNVSAEKSEVFAETTAPEETHAAASENTEYSEPSASEEAAAASAFKPKTLIINNKSFSADQIIKQITCINRNNTLTSLDLRYCDKITSENILALLKQSPNLTSLDLWGCSNLPRELKEYWDHSNTKGSLYDHLNSLLTNPSKASSNNASKTKCGGSMSRCS